MPKHEPEDISAGARVLATWKRVAKADWAETIRITKAVVAEVDRVRKGNARRARRADPTMPAGTWRVGDPNARERGSDLHEMDAEGRSSYIGTMLNETYARAVVTARREPTAEWFRSSLLHALGLLDTGDPTPSDAELISAARVAIEFARRPRADFTSFGGPEATLVTAMPDGSLNESAGDSPPWLSGDPDALQAEMEHRGATEVTIEDQPSGPPKVTWEFSSDYGDFEYEIGRGPDDRGLWR